MSDPVDQAAEVRLFMDEAIRKRKMGVEYGYDVTWMPAQSPQGTVVVYTLVLTRQSPLLGQGPLFHLMQVPSPRPTAGQVEDLVTDGIRQLSELFERMKKPPAAPPAQPPLALSNGRRS